MIVYMEGEVKILFMVDRVLILRSSLETLKVIPLLVLMVILSSLEI